MTSLFDEERMKIEPDHSNLLVIIIDMNPNQRLLTEDSTLVNRFLESIIAFGNCHLMQNSLNKIAVIASFLHTCKYLYCDVENDCKIEKLDGQYEPFKIIETIINDNFKKYVNQEMSNINEPRSSSLIACSISMALCYINRIKREAAFNVNLSSRILVITGVSNSTSHYMDFMNLFFTAQKLNILIDVCSLDKNLNLLQQGCDITGGKYLQIPQPQAILQYLLWVFLPDQQMRQKLNLPPPSRIDYRAACFCHQKLIDIGYVCSICLSVFCRFSPICTTCNSVFSNATALPGLSSHKKKKT